MKFISLAAMALYFSILGSFAQDRTDTASYSSRKLKLEEVNLVSGYYHQDGNNSAVTGGIGTEKLTDFANTIDLSLSKMDLHLRKHTFGLQLGVDTYTSASSDKIDPSTISSASSSDVRIYPSLSWSVADDKKGSTFGLTVSSSAEFDYTSFGGGINFSKASKDKNREFAIKAQAFIDTWQVILPIELRSVAQVRQRGDDGSGDMAPRNSFDLSLSYMQVINKNFQALLILEPAYQHGLLATKYQRVYFTDNSEQSENLPDKRYKLPIGLRLNYFAGDRVVVRSLFRYYTDDWGIQAQTIDLETPIKLTPFISLSPFYRYYQQTSADYFAGYKLHSPAKSYFTSDYDLSKFTSDFYGAGVRLAPPKGILSNHLNMLELRYGHYSRSNGLASDIVSLNLKFK